MTCVDTSEAAIARWFAHGLTSDTHPILAFALQTFFNPVGIEARVIEVEPFSALESGQPAWWLHEPKWNPLIVNRESDAAKDFGYLLESPLSFRVTVTPAAAITIERLSNDLATQAYFAASKEGWLAARHGVRAAAAAEAFVFGAAYLLATDTSLASAYATGDDAAFCAEVQRRTKG